MNLFEALGFEDGRAPIFVVGPGGTSLDPQPGTNVEGSPIAGTRVAGGIIASRFGFTTLERSGDDWLTRMRDATGAVIATCSTNGAAVSCKEGG